MAGLSDAVGPVMNTVPMRLGLRGGRAVREVVLELHRQIGQLRPHEGYPLAKIQQLVAARGSLFHAIIEFKGLTFLAAEAPSDRTHELDRQVPYPTLPYPALPYPTLPYPTLPYLA